jgi:hypothetical protein
MIQTAYRGEWEGTATRNLRKKTPPFRKNGLFSQQQLVFRRRLCRWTSNEMDLIYLILQLFGGRQANNPTITR